MTDTGQAIPEMKIRWVNHASFVVEFEDAGEGVFLPQWKRA